MPRGGASGQRVSGMSVIGSNAWLARLNPPYAGLLIRLTSTLHVGFNLAQKFCSCEQVNVATGIRGTDRPSESWSNSANERNDGPTGHSTARVDAF
jgi:hypothetical protein